MPDTTRIAPADLLAACETLGATPARGVWYDPVEKCGCGLGLYVAAFIYQSGLRILYRFSLRKAGVSLWYELGYVAGFDGLPAAWDDDRDYMLGHADGRDGWDAVKHLAREEAGRG